MSHNKNLVAGILAHVDAGKTTLIESMLYLSGKIKKQGRVDSKDSFLDFDKQERDRGITIYSKEAFIHWKDTDLYIADTPGHVDFSAEMERVLQILDCSILLVSALDGIQSHTRTIWNLLGYYHVPSFIFVNKMDIAHYSKEELLQKLKDEYSAGCIDFTDPDAMEQAAMTSDVLLDEFMESGTLSKDSLIKAIQERLIFPVFFGSALKNEGVTNLLDALNNFSVTEKADDEFGAIVYKIDSDENGNEQTHIKITSGTLQPKTLINEQKVDQIRLYNGSKYELLNEACSGQVVALKGLSGFSSGMVLGKQKELQSPKLQPCLQYNVVFENKDDVNTIYEACKKLAVQDPMLKLHYEAGKKRISLEMMGEVQIEIIKQKIKDLTGIDVGFETGSVIFKETIAKSTPGYGHFEPLRHYAEVHVRLDPLPRGKGIEFASECSIDDLSLNWQRLIETHVFEREHKGVLIGAGLTDVKVTLTAGKAHPKHTQGGDFRQALNRAIRQGLSQTENLILEPAYSFEIDTKPAQLSRILFELEKRGASVNIEEKSDGSLLVKGKGPARTLMNFQKELVLLSKGEGHFIYEVDGYMECTEPEKIIEESHYDFRSDMHHPAGSVFCAHGAGYYVEPEEVEELLHIPIKKESTSTYSSRKYTISNAEMKRVFESAGGQNRNKKKSYTPKPKRKDLTNEPAKVEIKPPLPVALIVDGYNMIYSWSVLKDIARHDLFGARKELVSLLENYAGYKDWKLIVVFDGYKNKDNSGPNRHGGQIETVYTRYGQTADSYIEKLVSDLKGKYRMYVATSDGLIQNSIMQHASRLSSRELEGRVLNVNKIALSHIK